MKGRYIDPGLPPLLLLALLAFAALRWAYGADGRSGALRAAQRSSAAARLAR